MYVVPITLSSFKCRKITFFPTQHRTGKLMVVTYKLAIVKFKK